MVLAAVSNSVVAFGVVGNNNKHRATGWWNTNHFLSFRNQDLLLEKETAVPEASTIEHNEYNVSFTNMNTNNMNNSVMQLEPNKTINSNREKRHSVPVLGPFLNEPSLLVGSTLYIDKPTPQQWKSLETSVQLQQEHKKNATSGEGFNLTDGYQAAPIVAILDNGTSQSDDGRFATLAAVVGISKSSNSRDDESENHVVTSALAAPLKSKIRLVGIARARLRDLYYDNVQNDTQQSVDQEIEQETEEECSHVHESEHDEAHESEHDEETGIKVTCSECGAHLEIWQRMDHEDSYLNDNDNNNDDDDNDDVTDAPVVMAEFNLVTDTLKRSTTKGKEEAWYKGAKSTFMSPVHALTEMSTLHNKLMRLHNERRKLVRDIKTAKFRLESNNIFEDLDGIGQATQKDKNDAIELQQSQGDGNNEKDAKRSLDASVLLNFENYGLAPYSSMSSLLDLTDATMQTLKPYYSPSIQQEEEFRLNVASFVAFKALEGFCSSNDVVWAMTCTNTVERLQRAHEIMTKHVLLLKLNAEQLKLDLKKSGQEYTDLF